MDNFSFFCVDREIFERLILLVVNVKNAFGGFKFGELRIIDDDLKTDFARPPLRHLLFATEL